MSFDEVRFPDAIAYGARGGPTWATNVASVSSGVEQRNQNWANARHSYNVTTGIKNLSQFSLVLVFFHARRGRLWGFRFKDWGDFRTSQNSGLAITPTDQALGTYAGQPMQLVKTYGDAARSWVRTIRKPVAGTLRVACNGVETLASGAYPWSIDTTTGLLTFTGAGAGLPTGQAITAGFEFDVPVRFDTDAIAGTYEEWRRLPINNITLIEVRL